MEGTSTNNTKVIAVKNNSVDDVFLLYGDGRILTKGESINFTGSTKGRIATGEGIPLEFAIGNTVKMMMTGAGNVGIGTSPTEKLEIAGWVRTSDGYKVGQNTAIDINRNFIGNNSTFSGTLSVTGTGNSSFMGNVGIGKNNPMSKLDVIGNTFNTARFQTGNNLSLNIGRAINGSTVDVWGTSYIGFNLYKESDNLWKTEYDGNNGGAMIYGTVGGSIVFTCVEKDNGITGPQSLTDTEIKDNAKMILLGNGLLKTSEVEVKLDVWSDYVFNEDYNLPKLSEVESFIKENNHLPDVPSEAEVLEEGINLGQMDALLLKKIEELTLYVIELKKENEIIKTEISKLKK